MDGAPDSRPSIRKVDPAELAPPVGFAHAMVASGGRTVYLAGQTALDATGVVVGKGIVEQVDRVLSNLCVALREAGGTPEDRKSTRLNSSHSQQSRMPSSA